MVWEQIRYLCYEFLNLGLVFVLSEHIGPTVQERFADIYYRYYLMIIQHSKKVSVNYIVCF